MLLVAILCACGGGGGGTVTTTDNADATGGTQTQKPVASINNPTQFAAPANPVDVADLFSVAVGDTWTYRRTPTGGVASSEIVTVTGTRVVQGVSAFVLSTQDAAGTTESLVARTAQGMLELGDSGISPALPALAGLGQFYSQPFPADLNQPVKIISARNVSSGMDLDADGVTDLYDVDASVTFAGFESHTISTIPQTFPKAGKFLADVVVTFTASRTGQRITVNTTNTEWRVAGIGLVASTTLSTGGTVTAGESSELVSAKVAGVVFPVVVPPPAARIKTITQEHSDLVFNAVDGKLYASVPGSAVANGNSVVRIDPATATITSTVAVGSQPGRLALSGDGRYLYVGLDGAAQIRRIDLQTMIAEAPFSLGADPMGPLYAEDIAVVPGVPATIAVSLSYSNSSPRHAGVAIYDAGVKRATATPGHAGSNSLAFSDSATTLYGLNNETTDFGLRTMTVGSTGVSIIATVQYVVSSFGERISFASGRIYTTGGTVLGTDGVRLGVFADTALTALAGCVPDIAKTKAYCAGATDAAVKVDAFDLASFARIGRLDTTVASSGSPRLVRAGASGMALSLAPVVPGNPRPGIALIPEDMLP